MILRWHLPIFLLSFCQSLMSKPTKGSRVKVGSGFMRAITPGIKRLANCGNDLKYDGSEWHCGNGIASHGGSMVLSLFTLNTDLINRCCALHDYHIDCVMSREDADLAFDDCLRNGNVVTRYIARPIMTFFVKMFAVTPPTAYEYSEEFRKARTSGNLHSFSETAALTSAVNSSSSGSMTLMETTTAPLAREVVSSQSEPLEITSGEEIHID